MKINKNKKGVIGSFMMMVLAMTIIAFLVAFLLMAASIREGFNQNNGEVIFKEDSLNLDDGVGYMKNYEKLVEARAIAGEDVSFNNALLEVGYVKK